MKFCWTTIDVRDLEESLNFYENIVGLKVDNRIDINITTEGLTLYELPVGTKLRIGEVLFEVTQIGKQCHKGCKIKDLVGECVMPKEGIFAKVLEEGYIKAGDEIVVV